MVLQNNFTLKHNGLTKSSSGFSKRGITSLTEIYDRPAKISQKKINDKFWRVENSHCGGRATSITSSDKVCHSSLFLRSISEKMKPCNTNPEIAIARAPQTTSTFSPSTSASLAASSSVSPWSPIRNCSRTPPGFSSPISTRYFSSGAHGGW